jgi:hypothetical protein
MASVTFDGRSFMLDGRRIWLMSGSMHYARVPADQWAERIGLVRAAGLNAIETPIYWNRHNPRPGVFDFTGDNDLRKFVQLVGQAGLWCVLRVGPFVGSDWDLGGIPPWVLDLPDVKLRSNNAPFLEACSKYITAVAEQVRDQQVTAVGKGGPILLIQNEHAWNCGLSGLASSYLGELIRYMREAGLVVPIINANSLWQSVEGEIDGWVGCADPVSTMRQLGTVRPDQPKLIVDFPICAPRHAGRPDPGSAHPMAVQRRIAEALAGAGQVNLTPFVSGNAFGFWGGRSPEGPALFSLGVGHPDAPVNEYGQAGASYQAARRICTFATRFSRLFAHLDPAYQPVGIDPSRSTVTGEGERPRPRGKGLARGPQPPTSSCVTTHVSGSQGGVVFVFGDDPAATGEAPRNQTATLLLSDGTTLDVHLGSQAVAWVILEVNLGGRARVNSCNLCVFASVGRVLVCYGPAGVKGVVSINGSPLEFTVPGGLKPFITEHENITIVACAEELIDHTFVTDAGVYCGVAGLNGEQRPIALPGVKGHTFVSAEGKVAPGTAEPARAPEAPALQRGALSNWLYADQGEYMSGESPRYATIKGPADLSALGCPFGYGWYRIALKSAPGHKVLAALPEGGDRLHVFVDGEHAGVMGAGPGAEAVLALPLRRSQHQIVVLAENFGRVAGGAHLQQRKGVAGHLLAVEPVKPGKSRLVTGSSIDVLSFRAPLWELREGDTTLPDRVTWTVAHRKKGPLLVMLGSMPGRALLVVNDTPVSFVDHAGPGHVVIGEEELSRGNNTVQLAIIPEATGGPHDLEAWAAAADEAVAFAEVGESITGKAEWAFAKWETPPASAFKPASGRSLTGRHEPTWWKSTFKLTHAAPLALTLSGMTKGQVYVNGRHVGRYFQAEASGAAVPPGLPVHVPKGWLKVGEENELVLFDEHGGHPARVELSAVEPAASKSKSKP